MFSSFLDELDHLEQLKHFFLITLSTVDWLYPVIMATKSEKTPTVFILYYVQPPHASLRDCSHLSLSKCFLRLITEDQSFVVFEALLTKNKE